MFIVSNINIIRLNGNSCKYKYETLMGRMRIKVVFSEGIA